MNMQAFSRLKLLFISGIFLTLINSCKKDIIDRTYDVNPITLEPSGSGKTKLKSKEQFIAILHANMFQKALSANEIFEISQVMDAIGDQTFARQQIISNFFNKTGVIKPSHVAMMSDVDAFVNDTYKRFFVRYPTEAEKTYVKNYINQYASMTDSSQVSPEEVYFGFVLSNEYLYY